VALALLPASACLLDGASNEPVAVALGDASCAEEAGASGGLDCHPRRRSSVTGAYFRKVTSLADAAHGGIVVAGRLPLVDLDPDRWFSTTDPARAYQIGPMDRPSLYLGGHASGTEVDAGLTWDRVYHVDGRPTWTDEPSGCDGGAPDHRFLENADGTVASLLGTPRLEGLAGLVPGFAFRAFWRAGQWNNPDLTSGANHYFYPGEPIRMAIHTVGKDTLALYIHPEPTDGREIAVRFRVPGFGRGAPQSFKRVNSIDQFAAVNGRRVGLETLRSEVLPTRSSVVGAEWTEVTLLGVDRAPRCALACGAPAVFGADAAFAGGGYDRIFTLARQTASGGEAIDIVP
jgi:hypothetical protein